MTLRVGLALVAAAAAVWPAAPAARLGLCPRAVQPLTEAPSPAERAGAGRAALRYARRSYAPRVDFVTDRMRVVDVNWAHAWPQAQYIRSVCGPAAWNATVAVSVVFPVMFDQSPRPFRGCSCAGLVVLVARGSHGWFVWDALSPPGA